MQDTLEVEVERHPMWDAPRHSSRHMNVLRQQIKRSLTPFDGRPGNQHVIDYCRGLYTATTLNLPVTVLVGQCVILRVMAIDRIETMLEVRRLPEQARVALRQQIKVIQRMSDEFATALSKSAVLR